MGMLDAKVAIVTGAGRGIGRAEALLLASEGASVVVNDLGVDPDGSGADDRLAATVVEEIRAAGGEAVPHFDDISEESGASTAIQLAIRTWGRLDIVVNNAGILRDRMIFNMSTDEWDSVMRVNLRGHFLMTRAACSYWRDRSKAGEAVACRIINTTSTAGILGSPGQANYGTAKAGIAAFTCIVALEMQRFGVTVNAVAPGARTRMTEKAFGEFPESESGFDPLAPENVAPLLVYIASDHAADITGQVFYSQGGLIQLYQGWAAVSEIEKNERWSAEEIAAHVNELFVDRPKTLERRLSPFLARVMK